MTGRNVRDQFFGPNGGHPYQRVLRSEQPFVIEMLDTVLQQTTP
jgi:hypothetical protein